MTVGIVMLVHTDLDRAEQIARHWVAGGCPVVIHVDKKVSKPQHDNFVNAFAYDPMVAFSKRHRCEWGMWGLVAATQDASELILEKFEKVRHVFLSSGACVPLRPVSELVSYLDANPDTDFIESASTSEVNWAVDGLEKERFTLRFPFSWRKQRRLFDRYVRFQRRIKFQRRIPKGIMPHIGSQWWCLTRQTLSAILQDPLRGRNDRYFRRVWIPDEAYFQTLSRTFSRQIQSRSLTLSKFDFQGKPHIFYDDHLQLLRRSDCFVARKIWPRAEKLYDAFLRTSETALKQAEPQPGKIDRLFSRATDRRTGGRPGLRMQSRFPNENWENGVTAQGYSVFEGFNELFEDFEPWLARTITGRVHGHLFGADQAEFNGRVNHFKGALSKNATLRDYDPHGFLCNLIWNTRGEHQCFQYGPFDNNKFHWEIVKDGNAKLSIISGAWLIRHFKSNANFSDIRADAALRQKIERDHITALKSPFVKAQYRMWTLAEFLESPVENLRTALDDLEPGLGRGLTEVPKLTNLTGFATFVRTLKNQGMHPYLLGDFRDDEVTNQPQPPQRKPYLVR